MTIGTASDLKQENAVKQISIKEVIFDSAFELYSDNNYNHFQFLNYYILQQIQKIIIENEVKIFNIRIKVTSLECFKYIRMFKSFTYDNLEYDGNLFYLEPSFGYIGDDMIDVGNGIFEEKLDNSIYITDYKDIMYHRIIVK